MHYQIKIITIFLLYAAAYQKSFHVKVRSIYLTIHCWDQKWKQIIAFKNNQGTIPPWIICRPIFALIFPWRKVRFYVIRWGVDNLVECKRNIFIDTYNPMCNVHFNTFIDKLDEGMQSINADINQNNGKFRGIRLVVK